MSSSDFDQRAQTRVGTTLNGKYRIDSVLGTGGMAVVYAATHRNQKRFAVKMLHRELSLEGDIHARFLREGYAANTVNHPGAVAVLDDDVAEDGAAFLVMELLEGETVDGLCTRLGGTLPLRAALGIAYQTLDVLEAAHQSAIVHRDIKPANLFLLRDGRVKVLDFGIARLRDATASHQATRTGAMLGTPAFMAPEQAMGEASEVGPQTDVWAVGATLFTLVSGALVHEGTNPSQLLVRAATVPARSLSVVAPDVPGPVVDLVGQALAFDRASRWRSAAAMREAVESVHRELFGEAPRQEMLVALFGTGRSDPPAAPPRNSNAPTPGESRSPSSQGSPPRASHRPVTMTAVAPGSEGSAPRPAPQPPVATSTAKPVSAGAAGGSAPSSSSRGPWVLATAGLLVAAVGAGIALRGTTPPKPGPSPATSEDRPAESAGTVQPHEDAPLVPATQPSSAGSGSAKIGDAGPGLSSSAVAPPPKPPLNPVHSPGLAHLSTPPVPSVAASSPDRNPLRMPLQ